MADERKFIGIEPQQIRNVGGTKTKVKGQTKNSVAETIAQISEQVVEQPAPVIEATPVKQNQTNTQIVNPELPPEVSDVCSPPVWSGSVEKLFPNPNISDEFCNP